jgi:hypothetical protein
MEKNAQLQKRGWKKTHHRQSWIKKKCTIITLLDGKQLQKRGFVHA